MSISWGNDLITKKPAQEGGPAASVNKRPSKMPVIEIGHLLARRRQQQQSRQPERAAVFEPDECGSGQLMAAKLPAALLGVVPESVLSLKRRAESSNSVGATPKRVKGITHPSPSFGSCGFPQAELGDAVENMGSRKNELHEEQSTAHLPSQRTASAARTAALTFRPDERGGMECGAAMPVCSNGRGRATVPWNIPTLPNNGRLQQRYAVPQQESRITEKGPTSCCTATMHTLRYIWDEESSQSQRDLISANEALEALLSRKRQAEPMISQKTSPKGAKGVAGQPSESTAMAKLTGEHEMLEIGAVAHSQPDYSDRAQLHGNEMATLTTTATASKNRCEPLKEPISSR